MMIKHLRIKLLAIAGIIASGCLNAADFVVVDMTRLFSEYYKVKDAQDKFQSSVQTSKEEIEAMMTEGRDLTEQYASLQERASSELLSEEAREDALEDAEALANEIRMKEAEVRDFQRLTQETLQRRSKNIINLHMDEIRTVVIDLAKERGADHVLNSADEGIVFVDEKYDITDDVLAILNADQDN